VVLGFRFFVRTSSFTGAMGMINRAMMRPCSRVVRKASIASGKNEALHQRGRIIAAKVEGGGEAEAECEEEEKDQGRGVEDDRGSHGSWLARRRKRSMAELGLKLELAMAISAYLYCLVICRHARQVYVCTYVRTYVRMYVRVYICM
jgi:hypothetical protein